MFQLNSSIFLNRVECAASIFSGFDKETSLQARGALLMSVLPLVKSATQFFLQRRREDFVSSMYQTCFKKYISQTVLLKTTYFYHRSILDFTKLKIFVRHIFFNILQKIALLCICLLNAKLISIESAFVFVN